MPELSKLVTTREAAALLGVSKSRVDQFVRDGRLSVAAEVGNARLFARAAVVELAGVPRKPGPR